MEAEDVLGIQPLYLAAIWGYNKIVKMLVEAGADIEHYSESPFMIGSGVTALKGAAAWGYEDTVQVVLS